MQASVDNEGAVSGRFNYRWLSSVVTKTQVQVAPDQSVFTSDIEYTGDDFSATIKTFNPSILEGTPTGIFIGQYLQAITPRLSLGLESVWQRPGAAHGPEALVTYVGRYVADDWIASMQLQPAGILHATFYKKIAERVEAGVDCQLTFAGRKDGQATFGAKYDFRGSTFRAQLNSQGTLSCLLEKRVAPAVTLTFSGDMDHSKVRRHPPLQKQC
jgi:mitochondrial import receptor subunit TOM40